MLSRRSFVGAAGLGVLARPAIVRAQGAGVLKFIPQSDLTILDPVATTLYTTRNHAFIVFDTLFGMDSQYRMQPQMLSGFKVEEDGMRWLLTLRDGLVFHDGEKVLARDCVASITRWAKRDALGGTLMAATEELSAPDDKTIQFRMKKRFPLLPFALGKVATPMCAMMPERLAKLDPFKPLPEIVGSGPFRFVANEYSSGNRAVYQRFDKYQPRQEATSGWTAGGKVVHTERVEWVTINDPSTAGNALMAGEVDWWEQPTDDLAPLLTRNDKVKMEITDKTGIIGFMKMNELQPPFNNAAIRRALLGAVTQEDYVSAIAGTDPKMWRTGVGLFCPGTDMANDAGLEVMTGPRDLAKVKAAIQAAGYQGEKVAVMVPTDTHYRKAMGEITVDMMRTVGLNVDYVAVDWGTAAVRRDNKGSLDKGGWSALCTTLSGLDLQNPTGHAFRTTGQTGWFGWADSPKIAELRNEWMDSSDLEAQKRIAVEMQKQWWIDVPHIPLGQWFQPTAYRSNVTNVLEGFPVFWGVKKA